MKKYDSCMENVRYLLTIGSFPTQHQKTKNALICLLYPSKMTRNIFSLFSLYIFTIFRKWKMLEQINYAVKFVENIQMLISTSIIKLASFSEPHSIHYFGPWIDRLKNSPGLFWMHLFVQY